MEKTMLVTHLLRERKLLNARFEKSLRSGLFVSSVKGDQKIPVESKFSTVDSLNSEITASTQRANDLLVNYRIVVAAIIDSNAKTMVTVGEEEMSVACAIEMRKSIAMEKDFLATLQKQLNDALGRVDRDNRSLDADIERRVAAMKSDGMTAEDASKLYEDTQARFYKEAKLSLSDPEDIVKHISELQEKLSDFDASLETALNISNATTQVTVVFK